MTTVGVVSELWRYPVKSMAGEQVCSLPVSPAGAVGDRELAVLDVGTGRILSAKTVPALLQARAAFMPCGEIGITLPDGDMVIGGGSASGDALSRWLRRSVRLVRPAEGRMSTFDLPSEDGLDGPRTKTMPAGSFADSSPLHLLSRSSIDAVRSWHPDGDWDVRRFRPNIVVDLVDDSVGEVETAWIGAILRMPSARIHLRKPTRRCVMVSHGQAGLPRDPGVLRTIAVHWTNVLGLKAYPQDHGLLRVGEEFDVELGKVRGRSRGESGAHR